MQSYTDTVNVGVVGCTTTTVGEVYDILLSSQETGLEMSMSQQFASEILFKQISYKQKADIYNVSKGYDTTKH